MINIIVKSLFVAGLLSSIIIALVLTLRTIFNDKISIRFINFLWIVVLIRLIVPFTLNTPFYVGDIFTAKKASTEINTAELPTGISEYLEDETLNQGLPSANNTVSTEIKPPNTIRAFFTDANWEFIAFSIWSLGVVILLVYAFLRIGKFKKLITKQDQCNDKRIYYIIEKYRKILKIDKPVTLSECAYIGVPVIIGIKNPVLLIPKGFLEKLDDNSISMIILHEMCHIKSKDIFKNHLWLLAKALNWYNPLVWIGYHKFLDDMEKHCDSLVLNHLDSNIKTDYFEALLNVIKLVKNNKTPASLLCFCKNKSKLRKRVDIMIKSQKPIRRVNILIAAIMIVAAFTCFTTACTGKINNSNTTLENTDAMPTPEPTFYDPNEDESLLEVPMPTPTTENISPLSPSQEDTVIYDDNHPLSREQLEKCENLEIRNVANLDFLKDLDNIKSISVVSGFNETVYGDVAVLATMDNLEIVRLSRTNIYGDIDSLKNLTKLQWLLLSESKITGDISSLENLTFLRWLNLAETDIQGDISVLENMIYLEFVALDLSNVTGDIEVLENCNLLKEVYMGATQVTGDIAVFANHTYLEWVALEGSRVYGDVASFANCQSLRCIYLSATQVKGDLSTLQGLESLGQVEFSGTNVTGELHIPPERAFG